MPFWPKYKGRNENGRTLKAIKEWNLRVERNASKYLKAIGDDEWKL